MNVKQEMVTPTMSKVCEQCRHKPRLGTKRIVVSTQNGRYLNQIVFCDKKCFMEFWEDMLKGI